MALRDLQEFLQERARVFDENLDVSSGSPFDRQVIQPVLRRLGTDPYTVDLATFLNDRLRQAFPDMASSEGDAITDLLIKPATLLWDSLVRETTRAERTKSLRDPETLTADEAEALGANLFSPRERGNRARGTGRIYFAQPRQVDCSPLNFFTSRTGLHFFPDGLQSITAEEMLLNQEGSLYYFDVNVVAEEPGTEYNITAGELVNIANIEGAARVTNLRRFRSGEDEESVAEYIGKTGQSLTERSMVTLRGIGAQLPRAFPEVTRLGVVGFGDPEMRRDVLSGGGLGGIVLAGVAAQTVPDGEALPRTRRVQVDAGVDLVGVLGAGTRPGYVLTLFSAFSAAPQVRDLVVRRVVSSSVLEVEEQVLSLGATGLAWTLRKRELTLSGIPGGILFPDSEHGTVTIPDGEVHVGGSFDLLVRGSDLEEATLVIENLSDADPVASGTQLAITGAGEVQLSDLSLGSNYELGGPLYRELARAKERGYSLQILEGPSAGTYRIIDLLQVEASSPVATLDTAIPAVPNAHFRWRLIDTLQVDLLAPRFTKVAGTDLQTIQNSRLVTTTSGVDFESLGVGEGDFVQIGAGPDAGDYRVTRLEAFNIVEVDRALSSTRVGIPYSMFSANSAGGVQLPLVRITRVELLDSSGQPVGSTIPYAKPVDAQSRAFENPGRGVKIEVSDATLGIVTQPAPGGTFAVGGGTMKVEFLSGLTTYPDVEVTFTAGDKTPAQVVAAINSAATTAFGYAVTLAVELGADQVGIVPLDPDTRVRSGTAVAALFGDAQTRTSADIRSPSLTSPYWAGVSPAINQDDLDVAQVLDGNQIGFYGRLQLNPFDESPYAALYAGDPEDVATLAVFAPEVGRRVQVGARSLGSVRCFFLEPTSVEFSRESFFTAQVGGATLRYFPEPTVSAPRIPAPPQTARPKDGVADGTGMNANVFTSASQDFVLDGIVPGDELVILYQPILGGQDLPELLAGLVSQALVLATSGGADQTIIFSGDEPSDATAVTREGVVSQINTAVGRQIVRLAGDRLLFEADVSISIRAGSANAMLGLSESNNTAEQAGNYVIVDVQPQQLLVRPGSFSSVLASAQSFEVRRPGVQRITATSMARNQTQAGLFYVDVELASEGTGDLFNIDAGVQLRVEGYRSDGYYLTTEDESLTFSVAERPTLHVSRSILEVGVSDSPQNATALTGQNIEITYERAELVADVQNFASSETERVVCANPLARHLVPHFIRYDFEYTGGSDSDLVLRDHEKYIKSLYPADQLEVSDLIGLASRRGASYVRNPIDLVAVVHHFDRSVWAQRSQDALNTGRLAAFIPDQIRVNRRVG